MMQTTFRRRRTRSMVEHARFLLKPSRILIKISLGLCLALNVRLKKERKKEKNELKTNTCTTTRGCFKSIESDELKIVCFTVVFCSSYKSWSCVNLLYMAMISSHVIKHMIFCDHVLEHTNNVRHS